MLRPALSREIRVASRTDCTGCGACASICPKGCILMKEDREGFLQPVIEKTECIKCHRCEKVCPILNPETINEGFETLTYAATVTDNKGNATTANVNFAISPADAAFSVAGNDDFVVGSAKIKKNEKKSCRVEKKLYFCSRKCLLSSVG